MLFLPSLESERVGQSVFESIRYFAERDACVISASQLSKDADCFLHI